MEKILIVDDSLLQATHLRNILGDEYDITIAQTPEEGLRQASSDSYSLILLDVVMPGMDGVEVMEKVKAEAPDAVVRRMMLSPIIGAHTGPGMLSMILLGK